eukprot:TRINITY_DN335_c0_g1_i7.p1 TRINITY_DN335_c0_g1~~TRINITY_DN335_c0_g1_i7.p1  ORF type:complete len:102 (+),score=24.75 TRINITY_DN335_c0_g1_i7:25-306(+)
MIRRPPRSTLSSSSAASDVYKRQVHGYSKNLSCGGFDDDGVSFKFGAHIGSGSIFRLFLLRLDHLYHIGHKVRQLHVLLHPRSIALNRLHQLV